MELDPLAWAMTVGQRLADALNLDRLDGATASDRASPTWVEIACYRGRVTVSTRDWSLIIRPGGVTEFHACRPDPAYRYSLGLLTKMNDAMDGALWRTLDEWVTLADRAGWGGLLPPGLAAGESLPEVGVAEAAAGERFGGDGGPPVAAAALAR